MFKLKSTGAALLLGVSIAGCTGPAANAPAPALEMAAVQNPPAQWWGDLAPCDEEDGTRNGEFGCYWDADTMGSNGEGTSFYTTANGTTVTVPADWE